MERVCTIEGCGRPLHCRVWCRGHYMKNYRYGDPLYVKERRKRVAKRRNWPKNTNATKLDTPCREWMGGRSEKGYGTMTRNRKHLRVHRYVWEAVNGPIPAGMVIMHRCDNPACFRIDHLMMGTPHDNSMDMAAKNRAPRASAKLNEEQVRHMRELYDAGVTVRDLSVRFGLHPQSVVEALIGKTWKHAGGPVQESAA